jgi:hypothetical protein
MSLDFKASQIRTTQLIVTGAKSYTPALMIYGSGSATSYTGAYLPTLLSNVGNDAFIFVSGSIGSKGIPGSVGTAVIGGDLVVSGTIYNAAGAAYSIGGGGGGGSGNWNELSPTPRLNTTASVSIAGAFGSSYAAQSAGGDVFFFVSGSRGSSSAKSTSGLSLFNGDIATSGSIYLQESSGFGVMDMTSDLTMSLRNRSLGGTFVASVNTTIGNTANFLDVRPNGAATNTKVAIMPSIYAGPASPFTSTDTNFFVGGSRTSRGGSTGGTAVFGGDVVISGSVYMGTSNTDKINFTGAVGTDIIPDGNRTRNLGSEAARFANVYTGDLHLKNERGDYTLIEEEDCLTIRFNKTGKRYRFLLEPAPEFDEK